ncbi:phage holin family protein [Homoserinibacter sp. YIM 151385]|uniref:phage holin family protein n=1 Tax=Homoserinibacter sp. YIM 151385 TaxID=2985506 RepID=UPI0022EFE8B0|nr:phage holin family protein [Homoserinibacter sp. YIM 151385]WBU37272.1 phage holin family protein [Homoserinibacter sp. YIM 151385]
MGRFILRLVINALALWLTTLLLGGHVAVVPFAPGDTLASVLTFLLVALIFGIVNGVIGNFVRIVAFPLYLLTLGLLALVVNGLLLLLVAWISSLFGFGLRVESFWWGVLGAVVLGLLSWLIGVLLRPLMGRRETR